MRGLGRLALLALSLVISLALAESLLRVRYRGTPWLPGAHIQKIQSLLVADPHVGFLWKPGIRFEDDVRIAWSDKVVEPLATDARGFRNHPAAIAALESGRRPDVVGLGDSFVHDAAYVLYELFRQHGWLYYSLAMHRHSPPQYDRILVADALPLAPRRILYGVFENDFQEAVDFAAWRRSGRDWFTFHSGTWSGPAQPAAPWEQRWQRGLPGTYALYRTLRGPEPAARRPRTASVVAGIKRSHARAAEAGVQMLVVLIPSKTAAVMGESPAMPLYDRCRRALEAHDIPVLDLRDTFAETGLDAREYYYVQDGHWNRTGIELAGTAVLDLLNRVDAEEARAAATP